MHGGYLALCFNIHWISALYIKLDIKVHHVIGIKTTQGLLFLMPTLSNWFQFYHDSIQDISFQSNETSRDFNKFAFLLLSSILSQWLYLFGFYLGL